MEIKLFSTFITSFFVSAVSAQTNNLPVKEWNSSAENPFVLFISGDSGLNDFSTGLCNKISKAGYCITGLSAKSYFWIKKTPAQTVADIVDYLENEFHKRPNQQLVLAGFSFGADVMPFIVNQLPDSVRKKIISVLLLSPSTSTDFEVHWSDILGGNKKRSMDVVAEINRMGKQKTIIIVGRDENELPQKEIKLQNYISESLPGGHHFDNNTDELARTMIKYFK